MVSKKCFSLFLHFSPLVLCCTQFLSQ
jgi:hypothetical protein